MLFFILIGCSNPDNHTGEETVPAINGVPYEKVATNLKEPWEIVMHGNQFFISERKGSIVEIVDGKLNRLPVNLEKDLSNQPEAGLLGIAFPSDFSDTAYSYYSYMDDNEYYQRVVEMKRMDEEWVESKVLIDHIPGGQYHQGGRIEIGPDEKIYITTGDATVPALSQDISSLAGKILRMNVDGSIPSDNPFPNSFVYSYGHRNPQGLGWDPDGNLYATEHGQNAHDEINLIEKGKNFGWSVIQGDETNENMETPLVHSGENTWAPSGMTYFDGKFYFASLRGEGIRQFDPSTKDVKLVLSDVGRVRDVLATDDGLYAVTNNTDGRGNPAEDDDQLLFIPKDVLKEFPAE
ncbi:PQQ-dependent sugar dehydrogenase [Ornithinibacillus sp. 179-J 7C1 HS]